MSLNSLDKLLGAFVEQTGWNEQPLQRVLNCWCDVVGVAVALHTRPVYVQRGVLSVATSSAAWAQNLTFERQRILAKLNPRLATPLEDIRFSTAGWQRRSDRTVAVTSNKNHPSCIATTSAVKGNRVQAKTPQMAFQRWAEVTRLRSQNLPLCPQCHCPTPPGELDRWQVCSLCAARKLLST